MCACEYTVVWSHLNGLSIPVENEGMGAFWVLNSTLMFYMSLLIHVPHCLHYYNSVLSGDWKLLSLLLFKDCFYSLGFLSFPHRFWNGLSVSTKSMRNFERNCIDSAEHFGEYCHLNNVKSSHPYTQGIFPFFRS